ncbi:MAG: lysophospholipid acyltransferase family protein [Brevinematia bacterium]
MMNIIKFIYTFIVLLILIPFAVILSLAGIILSIFSKKTAHYAEKIFFNIILLLTFTNVKIYGLENIDKKKNYIIVANHQSAFDIIVLSAKLPLQIRWVSKESIFRIPFIGQFMRAMGYISIPRESNIKKSVDLVKNKTKSIDGCPTIFPEGTRSPDGKLQRFKKGFILIAENTGLDLLPVVIKNTISIMRKGELLVTPFQKVELKILRAIPNKEIIEDQKITEKLFNIFEENL